MKPEKTREEQLQEAGNVLRDRLLAFCGATYDFADVSADVEAIKAWERI